MSKVRSQSKISQKWVKDWEEHQRGRGVVIFYKCKDPPSGPRILRFKNYQENPIGRGTKIKKEEEKSARVELEHQENQNRGGESG